MASPTRYEEYAQQNAAREQANAERHARLKAEAKARQAEIEAHDAVVKAEQTQHAKDRK